jgi:hypothetical protein
MPTATQITVTQLDLTGARCPALFCSGLQPSDAPTAGMVWVRQLITQEAATQRQRAAA